MKIQRYATTYWTSERPNGQYPGKLYFFLSCLQNKQSHLKKIIEISTCTTARFKIWTQYYVVKHGLKVRHDLLFTVCLCSLGCMLFNFPYQSILSLRAPVVPITSLALWVPIWLDMRRISLGTLFWLRASTLPSFPSYFLLHFVALFPFHLLWVGLWACCRPVPHFQLVYPCPRSPTLSNLYPPVFPLALLLHFILSFYIVLFNFSQCKLGFPPWIFTPQPSLLQYWLSRSG